jgi:hypothetical protein
VRAGSLSDPRVVALLRKYFLCVHVPDLVTKELMKDPRDLPRMQAMHEELRAGGGKFGPSTPGLDAGEREVFLDKDGDLVAIFLSLNVGQDKKTDQYSPEVRARPDFAVDRFFHHAAKALRSSHGAVPDDFTALREGTAPEVAQARALIAPPPELVPDRVNLRISLRSDLLMYQALSAERFLAWTHAQARGILPVELTAGTKSAWPQAFTHELVGTFHPPGAGVLLDLRPDSVRGELFSAVVSVAGDVVRGRFEGSFELVAATAEERGVRSSYRPFHSAAGRLMGDWSFDQRTGRFVTFRLVSEEGRSVFGHGEEKEHRHQVGVELLPR